VARNNHAAGALLHARHTHLDLGDISIMAGTMRVTAPLLDVLEVFVRASEGHTELHGWAIMKETKRSGPTVYGVLDRLEDMGWITGRWEDQNPEPSKPRRRFYQITPTGIVGAREILCKRRPRALHRSPCPALPSWVHPLRQGGTA